MSANYPASVEPFTPKVDGPGNTILADHINALQDAIVAVETALLTGGLEHNLFPESSADARTLGTSSKFWGLSYLKGVSLSPATTLTVASGIVTNTQGVHALDTEGAAASDDLDTITAGAGIAAEFVLVLRAANVAHVVTLKDGTGNLILRGPCALDSTDAMIALLYDGTNWREVGRSVTVGILDRNVTTAEIVSNASEATVYTFSVPANTLGTNRSIRLTLVADYLNNTGAPKVLNATVKYGGSVVGLLGNSLAASATRYSVRISVDLNAFAATGTQVGMCNMVTVPGITGGASGGSVTDDWSGNTGLTVDSTAAQTLLVTVTLNTSSASLSFKIKTVQVELL